MEVSAPLRKRQKRRSKAHATIIKTGKRLDFVTNKFSKELVLKVFSFLSSKDLIQCAVVSLEWSRMANDEMLWKPLFFRRFQDPLLVQDRQSNFQYNRRSSVTRYGGSWKTKYRIHHNWVLGNCYINDIVNTFNNNSNLLQHPHQLQFLHDTLFLVQNNSSSIDIWKYVESGSTYISQLQSSAILDNVHITFLKLIEGTKNYLVAGYSNGGFSLWEIKEGEEQQIREIINYTPSNITCNDKVKSIGMEYPMILVCTQSMKLSVFHVDDSTFSLGFVHRLQSPIEWSPVVIDIQQYHPPNKDSKRDLWKVVVCFGLSGGNFTTSIGIQELVLSANSVISSKHGFALNYEPIYPSSSSSSTLHSSSDLISSMVYSPPHLITAHPNNTMKQYTVIANDNTLDIAFEQTLYGHTYQVDALAIDAPRRKLLSGDRSCIKIWDLSTGECQVNLGNHKNQSQMDELPPFDIETLGLDEDKIVAVVNCKKKSFIRLWSFNSMLK